MQGQGDLAGVWWRMCAPVALLAFALLLMVLPASASAHYGNDNFASAETITASLPTDAYGNTSAATSETGEPSHAGVTASTSVWFKWTPSASGNVRVRTCWSDVDTVLAVYTGTGVGALTPVASNDDGGSCDTTDSSVEFNAVAGTTYRIAVDSKGDQGYFELDLTGRPANDAFSASQLLSGGQTSASGTNDRATKETNRAGPRR